MAAFDCALRAALPPGEPQLPGTGLVTGPRTGRKTA
jgi:hypothetical protein